MKWTGPVKSCKNYATNRWLFNGRVGLRKKPLWRCQNRDRYSKSSTQITTDMSATPNSTAFFPPWMWTKTSKYLQLRWPGGSAITRKQFVPPTKRTWGASSGWRNRVSTKWTLSSTWAFLRLPLTPVINWLSVNSSRRLIILATVKFRTSSSRNFTHRWDLIRHTGVLRRRERGVGCSTCTTWTGVEG